MKIVIISAYFPPQASAGANRIASFARGLKSAGWEVNVVAPWFDGDALHESDEDLKSITVWTPYPKVRRHSFVARFFDESRIAFDLARRARKTQSDVYLITNPYMSFVLISAFLLDRSKLATDIRDLTWEYPVESFLPRVLQFLLGRIALVGLSRSRLLTASTEAELAYLRRNIPNIESILVSNGIEDAYISTLETGVQEARREGFLITYIGTVGRAQGLGILLEAAEQLPQFRFCIVGEGDELERLRNTAANLNGQNVSLVGRVPRGALRSVYLNSSVLFLRLQTGFSSAIPSKVYEYLAAGCPIIYMGDVNDTAWKRLSEFEGTHRINNGDLSGLTDAILTIERGNGICPKQNRSRLRSFYTREAQALHLGKNLEHVFVNTLSLNTVTEGKK